MNTPANRPQTPSHPTAEGRLEVGKLAYQEARNAFEMVNAQFSAGMNRIVQLLTFSVASISFLAGQVLDNQLGTAGRVAAVAAGLVTAAFCAYTVRSLMPAKEWNRGMEGGKIVERYIQADIGAGDATGAYEKLAAMIADDANENQTTTDALLARIPRVGFLALLSFGMWLVIAIATSST